MASFPYYAPSALDAQLQYIIDNAETQRIVEGYDQADTHAQVVSKTKATVAINGEFGAIGTVNTYDRRVSVNQKDGAGTIDHLSPTDLWIVITKDSATAEVLSATNETTDKPIGNLDVVQFPSYYLEARQPTQEA